MCRISRTANQADFTVFREKTRPSPAMDRIDGQSEFHRQIELIVGDKELELG